MYNASKIMKRLIFVLCFALVAPASHGYDVVLKTGKVIRGTIVKEDDNGYVIKNDSGIEFTISKKNVDASKTAAANVSSKTDEKSLKKPARVYTKEDIERVREKINLGTFEGAVPIHFTKAFDADAVMDRGFETEVLDARLPVLVDFYADWCGPCRAIAPRVAEVGAEFEGRAKIYRVNIDKNEDLSRIYDISSIPTLIFFKDGEAVERLVGLVPKSEISKKMKSVVE